MSWDPPMYGRLDAGHSSTMAIHHPAATTVATPIDARCPIRRQKVVGAANRYTSANAGRTRNDWSILARNANPTSEPANVSQRHDACSRARVTAYAAPHSNSMSSASGLLNRNMRAATGVVASTTPARSAAPGRNHRLTLATTSATDPTPINAWGTRIDHELTPKRRAEIPMTHSAAGALSTVMALDASNEPKKNAFQLEAPACTAAE